MQPVIRTKWVEALRSNRYPQTRCKLRGEEGFCCMGVLCLLIAPEAFNSAETKDEELSPSLLLMAGLSSKIQSVLISLNDGRKEAVDLCVPAERPHTFAEIADYIETHL